MEIVKNTKNSCVKCKRSKPWIYCKFHKECLENKNFDETGENDGCNKFVN